MRWYGWLAATAIAVLAAIAFTILSRAMAGSSTTYQPPPPGLQKGDFYADAGNGWFGTATLYENIGLSAPGQPLTGNLWQGIVNFINSASGSDGHAATHNPFPGLYPSGSYVTVEFTQPANPDFWLGPVPYKQVVVVTKVA